ncbi:TPA_asm: putative Bcl-2 protein [Vaccinia virus]|uniref:Putative K7R n=1 Tax=Vaccinia virus TaxID=10245 RepID=A0A7D3QP37_VACCV|nr:putative K7R [Vaccinia virus]DAD52925.1 TPA_asm: putative Bcl-2 protein [Vaccinia virus]DAD53638.1 TPA_asm: putative Bcl-2 protein [Vaccinia virus]DAD53891.1 TPA_asm: putative Bcl-2 protein [Vaccinia virus]
MATKLDYEDAVFYFVDDDKICSRDSIIDLIDEYITWRNHVIVFNKDITSCGRLYKELMKFDDVAIRYYGIDKINEIVEAMSEGDHYINLTKVHDQESLFATIGICAKITEHWGYKKISESRFQSLGNITDLMTDDNINILILFLEKKLN